MPTRPASAASAAARPRPTPCRSDWHLFSFARGEFTPTLCQLFFSELGGSEGIVDLLPRVARVGPAPSPLRALPVRLPVHLHLHPRLRHDLSANVLPVRRPASVHTVKRSASLAGREGGQRGGGLVCTWPPRRRTAAGQPRAAPNPCATKHTRLMMSTSPKQEEERKLSTVPGIWVRTCGGRPAPAAGRRSRTGSPAHTPPGSACPRCPPTAGQVSAAAHRAGLVQEVKHRRSRQK